MLRKFNKAFNNMIERIVEKIHWENTASNQRTVSFVLGCIVSFILMIVRLLTFLFLLKANDYIGRIKKDLEKVKGEKR